eukprot:TRINITY_DN5614_c0_g1_i1.p1 TRINITY_DN5614_c0_g1~~TRINITY_DN5614_c0_g1_i1.p1  ORF type:complete len:329 (+),score=34.65 TRINITY_DN5614_c0_g1_i1:57-989(+)
MKIGLLRQIRSRARYATYEDQVKFGTSVATKPDFTKSFEKKAFVKDPDTLNVRRRNYYNTKSVSQAVQFMQANHIPPPPEDDEVTNLTYSRYLAEAFQTEADGSRSSTRTIKHGKIQEDHRTKEEQEAFAKKVERDAKDMGRKLLDNTGRLRDLAADEAKRVESEGIDGNEFIQREPPPYLKSDFIDEVLKKADATPMPLYERMKGTNQKEKLKNYDEAMRKWEESEKIGSQLIVDIQRRNAEEGAPVMHNWTRGQEAVYEASRKEFFKQNLKKPGWTEQNFGPMYAMETFGKQVGQINTKDLKSPEWQL